MAHIRYFQWFVFLGILASVPEPSVQQMGDSASRFNPDSRPNVMTLGTSTPVPLDIERQLELINQQQEKLEQMKKRLVQQLDKFRDEYMDSILSTSSIIMSTIRPPPPTTPALDKTTTKLMEIRDTYMEIEVKSPIVILTPKRDQHQFVRS